MFFFCILVLFRPPEKCPKKLYDEGFDHPALEWQGLDRWQTSYDTPKFWMGLTHENDLSPYTSTSYFKIDKGKLVGRDIGDGSRPKNSVFLKTQEIDVEDLEEITVFVDIWKEGI